MSFDIGWCRKLSRHTNTIVNRNGSKGLLQTIALSQQRRRGGNEVVVANHTPRHRIRKNKVTILAQTFLRRLGYGNIHLTIVFVSDQKIKQLNRDFLNHPWPTDVLAFPMSTPRSRNRAELKTRSSHTSRGTLTFLGEVVISPLRAKIQAKRFGTSWSQELTRYIGHGILHLSGYTDRTRHQQRRMRNAEDRLMKSVSAISMRVT